KKAGRAATWRAAVDELHVKPLAGEMAEGKGGVERRVEDGAEVLSKAQFDHVSLLEPGCGAHSISRPREQPLLLKHPQILFEHGLRVHHCMEAGLHDLDGRGERGWCSLGAAKAHLVVGILERKADKGAQIRRDEIVSGANARPVGFPRPYLMLETARHV